MNLTRVLAAPVRAVVWTFDLCDPRGNPSLSKGLAFGFGVLIARDVFLHGVTGLNVGAMALVLSAAFGRSVFMNWLGRNTWTSNASVALTGDAANVVKELSHAAERRRIVDLGVERSGTVPQMHDD